MAGDEKDKTDKAKELAGVIDVGRKNWGIVIGALLFALAFVLGVVAYIDNDASPGEKVSIWFINYTKKKTFQDISARIEGVRGNFRITGEVDKNKRLVWNNENLAASTPSPYNNFSFAKAWRDGCYQGPRCNRSTEWTGKIFYDDGAGEIDAQYKNSMESWYQSIAPFLQSVPSTSLHDIAIAELPAGQSEAFKVIVRPVSPQWALTIVITQGLPGGKEKKLSVNSFSNEDRTNRRENGTYEFNVNFAATP